MAKYNKNKQVRSKVLTGVGRVYTVNIADVFYVGSTIQSAVQRSNEHLSLLRRGDHYSKPLQEAFDLYGDSNFKYKEIATAATKTDIRKEEQRVMDSLKALEINVVNHNAAYNPNPKPAPVPGRKRGRPRKAV